MTTNTSRSPSPPAAPPVAASPGPRAATLIKLYNDAIAHTMKSCSYENFSSCFPTIAQNVPDALQALHKDFVDRLGEHCRSEFDAILRERNVVVALNDLDRLVEEARKRKAKAIEQSRGGPVQAPTPPHTLPAQSLYLAHLSPTIEAGRSLLQKQLDDLQTQNEDLVEKMLEQRAEIKQVVGAVEAVVADLDASLEALPNEQMRDLTAEAVSMDVEMRSAD